MNRGRSWLVEEVVDKGHSLHSHRLCGLFCNLSVISLNWTDNRIDQFLRNFSGISFSEYSNDHSKSPHNLICQPGGRSLAPDKDPLISSDKCLSFSLGDVQPSEQK